MTRIDSEPLGRPGWGAAHAFRYAPGGILAAVVLITVSLTLAPATEAQTTQPAQGSQPGAAKVLAEILYRAVSEAEELRLERLRVQASASSVRATIRPDPLAMEFQTEGIGEALDREAHALDAIRLVSPLALPGQRNARRATERVADSWSRAALTDATWRVAAEAARHWSTWAAVEAEAEFRRERLRRSTRAVDIFEARLEEGEVSGSQVRQLEAQRAEDRAALLELDGERRLVALRLRQLLGFEARAPEPGSLAELTAWLRSPVDGGSAPTVVAWRSRAELEAAQAQVLEKTAQGTPELAFQLERVPSVEGLPAVESFGLQLRLPLALGRRSADRKQAARDRAESARYESEQMVRRHRERVEVLRELEEMVSSSLEELAPLADRLQQARDSLFEQFRLDAISYLAFLDGADRLDQVRLRQLELQRQLVQTRIELAVAVGDDSQLPLGTRMNQTNSGPDR